MLKSSILEENKALILLLVFASFFVSRLILVGLIDVGTDHIAGEEFNRRGRMAIGLIKENEGPLESLFVPFEFNYIYGRNHQTGTTLRAFPTALFFIIFGVNIFSLVLIDLITASLLLFLVFLLFDSFFDTKAALFSSLVFLFSFPTWISQTISQAATHFSGITFGFLIIYLSWRLIQNQGGRKWYTLLGFACGLSLFIDVFFALFSLSAVVISLLLFRLKRIIDFSPSKGEIVSFFASFLLGLIPFIYYHFILSSQNPLRLSGNSATPSLTFDFISKRMIQILPDLTKSFGYSNSIFGGIWMLLTFASFIYVVKLFLTEDRSDVGLFPFVCLLVIAILNLGPLIVSRNAFQYFRQSLMLKYRYAMFFHLAAVVLVPYFVLKISKRYKKIGKALVLLVLLLGLFSFIELTEDRGYYIHRPVDTPSFNLEKGTCMDFYRHQHGPMRKKLGNIVPEKISWYPSSILNIEMDRSVKNMKDKCISTENTSQCYQALGYFFGYMRPYDLPKAFEICDRSIDNSTLVRKCKSGAAIRTGFFYGDNRSSAREKCIRYQDKYYKEHCFEGIRKCRELKEISNNVM